MATIRATIFSGEFEDVGAVSSDAVIGSSRMACLDPFGIALLQQRYVNYLTRIIVPLQKLSTVCAPVLDEAELLEDWLEASLLLGISANAAEERFDAFIRDASRPGGVSLQDDLKDPMKRGAVFRAVRERIEAGL
jgi:hypothetical protein